MSNVVRLTEAQLRERYAEIWGEGHLARVVAELGMIDLMQPVPIEVRWTRQGKLWVNAAGKCILRVNQYEKLALDPDVKPTGATIGGGET